jgi:hypothetical protein
MKKVNFTLPISINWQALPVTFTATFGRSEVPGQEESLELEELAFAPDGLPNEFKTALVNLVENILEAEDAISLRIKMASEETLTQQMEAESIAQYHAEVAYQEKIKSGEIEEI